MRALKALCIKLEATLILMAVGAGLCASSIVAAETRVNVVGLFSNKAVVIINGGKPKTLSVGQTSEGVKLIAANSSTATLLIEGKTQQLGMGQAASIAGDAASTSPSVTLYADVGGHHRGDVSINGAILRYVVDTGATSVALNSGDAKYAKIDYKKGEPILVSTANGIVKAYLVRLNTLKLGSIVLNNVEAGVLEGGFPSEVLLGNSVLSRLDMKRDGPRLTLSKRY